MIVFKQLDRSDIGRIREIDRTEHITVGYTVRDGRLLSEEVDWHVPRWPEDGPDDFSIRGLLDMLTPILEGGGVLLGALDGDLLVGFAVLRYKLTDTMAQLAAVFVSDGYRRQGIASRLTEEAIRLAKEAGAKEMYVSATPSESAVGFYLSHGFELAEQVNQELYALEPEDVHMTKSL